MADSSKLHLLSRIEELENRLEESEQLINAIKAGEVDAFAINNENEPEIYTLQSGDYAYRILIEEFGEGAVNVTEDGLVVYTNPYFCELLQLPYEKVVGATIFEFVERESQTEFKELFLAALSGKSKGEINLKIDGRTIPVYVSLTSLQPKLATVGIIITDFTEKKKNEQLILEYHASLEHKNLELIQSNTELASFAYIASHDLQEPLRKIQTFATLIPAKEQEHMSESSRDHFGRMQNAAKRMQTLIEDLLTYSRTNTVERKFVRTDLMKIVGQVQDDMKENLVQKQATIETGTMCELNIIPFQFRQLLTNLVSNSLKFSSPDRRPVIKIYTETADSTRLKDKRLLPGVNYCHIHISDNGIGFEQQYGEQIFELFRRLHGKTEYNGTGIGLAIVKKIVENHNGVINAKGALGEGAAFDIFIPK